MDATLAALAGLDAALLDELAPLLRRATDLDAAALVRLRGRDGVLGAFVKLPFKITVSRSLRADVQLDLTATASDLLSFIVWAQSDRSAAPPEVPLQDLQWREALPPLVGWRRIENVPDDTIRGLVRTGALTLKEAGRPGGMLETQPRAADALLDTVVLAATNDGSDDAAEHPLRADITLRMVSALTRMGFLPRGSHAAIDVAGSWTRIAAAFGSVYTQASGLQLR